jgi:hypothetical protein
MTINRSHVHEKLGDVMPGQCYALAVATGTLANDKEAM